MEVRERIVTQAERDQRGCQYCEESRNGWMCPYEVCPYTEMDGFTKYQDYLKSTGGESVRKLLRKKVKYERKRKAD